MSIVAVFIAIKAHEGDQLFALRQRNLTRLSAHAVNTLVGTAPDPRGRNRRPGTARCRPGRRDDLRNPWSCTITYSGRLTTRYLVTIRPNGSYIGHRLDDVGQITGCCTQLSGLG
jgi:hypothetical protein